MQPPTAVGDVVAAIVRGRTLAWRPPGSGAAVSRQLQPAPGPWMASAGQVRLRSVAAAPIPRDPVCPAGPQPNEPLVTVIMPTHNRSALLREAISSVITQTYTNWELIVVDDGSTDDTAAVVAAVADSRVRYIRTVNAGPAAARNTGIGLSRAEYIAFLDDDDTWMPDKLSQQLAFMSGPPMLGWSSTGFVYTDLNGHVLREERPWERRPRIETPLDCLHLETFPGAVMVTSAWLRRVGGFDARMRHAEDTDLWVRLGRAGCRMAWMPSVLSSYRIHGGNAILKAERQTQGRLRLLAKLLADPDLPPEVRSQERLLLRQAHTAGVCSACAASDVAGIQKHARLALAFGASPHLEEDGSLVDAVVGWALGPLAGADPESHVRSAMEALRSVEAITWPSVSAVLLRLRQAQFSAAYRRTDLSAVRRLAPCLVVHDPRWLWNRGVASICLEAIVGTAAMQAARHICRRLRERNRAIDGSCIPAAGQADRQAGAGPAP